MVSIHSVVTVGGCDVFVRVIYSFIISDGCRLNGDFIRQTVTVQRRERIDEFLEVNGARAVYRYCVVVARSRRS